MPTDRPATAGLTATSLAAGWRRAGVGEGTKLIVHSSLSSLGRVQGGAATVVESLLHAVGPTGTVVAPTFTPQVADPAPDRAGVPDTEVRARRDTAPTFHPDLPSSMGAVPETLRALPEAVRSTHPQASVAAVGAHAAHIVARQPLGLALGADSPFERLYEVGGHILLVGVGHSRNSFLHHAESRAAGRRLKLRRFPTTIGGERVWCETLDVGDDNGTHFPTIGREFERQAGISTVPVGDAVCRLLPARPFVDFAVRRLEELLAGSPERTDR
ncbi:aminoglycoside N(3)-acetyltransferase [Qaidamihabitans albus]|uniref:aminoglycoside N(3)-acetyltransferase n=1 Tax=Qaidamihabitans albus TaxID=2795733 RepID=UPI0018F13432|nr:AAC(3) family N-acetyltransferase [Qaidamihabitans albus]